MDDKNILEFIKLQINMATVIILYYYNISNSNDKLLDSINSKDEYVEAFVSPEFGYFMLEILNLVGKKNVLDTIDEIDEEDYLFTYNGVYYYIDESVPFADIRFNVVMDKEYEPIDRTIIFPVVKSSNNDGFFDILIRCEPIEEEED